VANTLRLLKLPEKVKALIHGGKLSAGHARMLVGQADAEVLAENIVARGLNVREVEALSRQLSEQSGKPSASGRKARSGAVKSVDTLALEKRLSDALGLVVSIEHRAGRGTLTIRYRDIEQLDDVVRRLEGHR